MRRLYPFVQVLVASSIVSACALDARGRKLGGDPLDTAENDSAGSVDPLKDGTVDRPDAMLPDLTPDEQRDTGIPSAQAPDLTDDAGSDASAPAAPPTAHVTDGITTQGEWDGATWSYQGLESDWGPDRNTLASLAVEIDEDFVWLRVEGKLEFANAISVYFDSVTGAGLSPHRLTDRLGSVDDAISSGVVSPKAHAPDFAWATRSMDGDGALVGPPGFRELSSPADLGWIDEKLAPTVCLGRVCEARIDRDKMHCGDTLYVFARLVNATGDLMSNQILPFQPDGPKAEIQEVLMVQAQPDDAQE